MQDSWQQVKHIFLGALERPANERSAFVHDAAGADPIVLAEVESLLQSEESSGSFLEQPPAPLLGAVAVDVPLRIGPYRVVREIGHGGMGAVYLAVRDDDTYAKQVAIKMIGAPAVTALAIERFRHERQILANLDHPNIARLLDGGATPAGLPYVVIEYVDGVPIDQFVADRRLPIPDRLRLFVDVCGAVQYAHQRLVVHRDLKPGNILVTSDGMPKLLDFGIAKLIDETGTAHEPTVTAQRMLTPECASPEQIRGEPITTASDVYALGILLYRLLTGEGPYGSARAPHELARAICEQDLTRPSDVAAAPVGRQLRGDLDTIVLKAADKLPARRYATAQQLADDVRRHLSRLPVVARPDTIRYRAAKFVTRHKPAVAATAVVIVSLAAGIVATAWEAHVARLERARAERRFNDVRKLASSFLFEFHDAIEPLQGATDARQLVVAKALEYLDQLAHEARDDVQIDLKRELVDAYVRLGDVQGRLADSNLGQSQGAMASYGKALELAAAVPESGRTMQDEERLARAHGRLGDALRVTGDTARALKEYRSALETWQRIASRTQLLADRVRVTDTRCRLAEVLVDLGAVDTALSEYRSVVTDYRGQLADAPGNTDIKRGLAVATYGTGAVLERRADWAGAAESFRAALAGFEELAASRPTDVRQRRGVYIASNELGRTLRQLKDFRGAAATLAKAGDAAEMLLATDPRNAQVRRDRAIAWINLAEVLEDDGRPAEARPYFERSMKEFDELARADAANMRAARAAAMSRTVYGRFLVRRGEAAAAVERLRSAESSLSQLAEADRANAGFALDLAYTQSQVAAAYERLAGDAVSGRSVALRRIGCDWYRRSADLFDRLRAQKRIAPEDEPDVKEAAAGVRRCRE